MQIRIDYALLIVFAVLFLAPPLILALLELLRKPLRVPSAWTDGPWTREQWQTWVRVSLISVMTGAVLYPIVAGAHYF